MRIRSRVAVFAKVVLVLLTRGVLRRWAIISKGKQIIIILVGAHVRKLISTVFDRGRSRRSNTNRPLHPGFAHGPFLGHKFKNKTQIEPLAN